LIYGKNVKLFHNVLEEPNYYLVTNKHVSYICVTNL